jgi:hypothetical protein
MTDFSPPLKAFELTDCTWSQPRLRPVLLHRETAFKYKIQRYTQVMCHRTNPKLVLSSIYDYVRKEVVFRSWEDAHKHLLALHENRVGSHQAALDRAKAALTEARTLTQPVHPEIV